MSVNTQTANNRTPEKLNTEEFAALVRVKPQTVRAALCRAGHYLGMRPIKLSTGKLLWDASEAEGILNGEVAA